MKLVDLLDIPRPGCEKAGTLAEFLADPRVAQLRWPGDVVDQWLWEHGRHEEFLDDYGDLELESVQWSKESLSHVELVSLPTGPSESAVLEQYAVDHRHWVRVRPPEIAYAWETAGTWLRAPLLIDRALLNPPTTGLQVVEGRTRVGVLRGRYRDGLRVAPHHMVWIGR
ncbi:hypothetical protein [Nocardia ignorata]|uniref:hypothetical protein n=1 Tax=Nocardia ignorata TaxID=145285 RepID=UPI00082EDF0D|nr:hypothetical protein [Nocardia ignorata]